jgi:thiamine biosynthesis lipoprotein
MGLPVSIDVRDPGLPAAVDAAFGWLRRVDRLFSTYRDDSEVARINRGELREADADPDVRAVLAECRALRERSGGAFDAEAAAGTPEARERPGCGGGRPGAVEPAGYVKGWAVDRAWRLLEAAGARNALVDGGGDLVVRGRPEPGRSWRIGIQHPTLDDRLAAVLEPGELCVATSGEYRRGRHIVDPLSGRPPAGLLSITCVARDLATADALATAGFAMGADGARWLAAQPGVEAMAIDTHGQLHMTPGFDAMRVSPERPPNERNHPCHEASR